MFRKFLALILALLISGESFVLPVSAVVTDGSATNWTRSKAEFLARKTLFGPTQTKIDQLFSAGSASAAVGILFPDQTGPSRTQFDSEMAALTASGFNWGDGGNMARYYQYHYARDPYEAKAKLSSLFEDIFAVNQNGGTIVYRDVKDLHDTLYSETLGNYKTMVKKVLFNGTSGDYAAGKFLDLLDGTDKRYPNENYARELLQLFLMGEYEPGKSKDAGDVRNYEETDVASLAKILTGFRSDSVTHQVSYDPTFHNTATGVVFLSGAASLSFPFYNSASGVLDLGVMDDSIMGNNGLADNALDYIFAKRDRQVAYFLADRLFRFYIHDHPTRTDLDPIVASILSNSFDLLPTVRSLLASDSMYSDTAMNAVMYKNPLELTIGTAKLLHATDSLAIDPLLRDTSLLGRFNWTPYIPGSVFGRDGFDENAKWYSTYIQNQWISYANTIAYNTSSGSYLPSDLLGNTRLVATGSLALSAVLTRTYTGHVDLGSGTVALVGSTGSLSFGSPSFSIPDIQAMFATGGLKIYSGSIDFSAHRLLVSSGSFTQSGITYPIASADFELLPSSEITRSIDAGEVIDRLESSLLLGRRLPDSVRTSLAGFLTTSETGATIAVHPIDASYMSKKIRWAVAIILSEPEYVLQTGYDVPPVTQGSAQTPLSSSDSKLVFVELPGGYDWLHGVIPKDEYTQYVTNRTTASGTMAMDLPRLTDLDPTNPNGFYLNNAIAYGSGGAASFKSLFDSNNLRIFNRVGTPKHSRDHDAAQKQITSYGDTTLSDADGVFGQMIRNHSDDMDTISLTGRRPNVFRNGRYVNIGPSGAIFSHPRGAASLEGVQELSTVRSILAARSYPGSVAGLFKWAVKVDDVATRSKSSGGPDGAGYGNVNNLAFLRTLLANHTGKTFYLQADGGYDTHSAELAPQSNFDPSNIPKDLNYNIGKVAENLTKFFNDVKDREDITIVVFSEFGRTLKTNGDLGTDHGEGGGMFVLSNNQTFLAGTPAKISGNLSFKSAKDNWLGVGIDYRAVYGKIYQALYGLSDATYFGETVRLEDDVSTTPSQFVLSHNEFRPSGSSVVMNIPIRLAWPNFDPHHSSYVTIEYGTGLNALKKVSQWTVDNTLLKSDGTYRYATNNLAQGSSFAYRITAYNDQYVASVLTGSLTVPRIVPGTGSGANTISRTGDSVFSGFANTTVTGATLLAGTGIIIANNASGATARITARDGITIETGTGLTAITSLTSSSGSLAWSGGFILGEAVTPSNFLARGATIVGSGILTADRIARMIKIGADVLGVGMRLNKSVSIEVGGLTASTRYDLVSSEDGIAWTRHGSGSITADLSGKARFDTDHFTYFAFVTPVVVPVVVTPVVTPPVSGGSNGGGGGGGGGGLSMDSCPNGDRSPSFYDRTCGTQIAQSVPSTVTSVSSGATSPAASDSTPQISSLLADPVIREYVFIADEKIPQKVASGLNFFLKKLTDTLDTKSRGNKVKQVRYYQALDAYMITYATSHADARNQRLLGYLRTRLRVVSKGMLSGALFQPQQTAVATVPLFVTSFDVSKLGIDLNNSAFSGYDFSQNKRFPQKIAAVLNTYASDILTKIDRQKIIQSEKMRLGAEILQSLDLAIKRSADIRDQKVYGYIRNRLYVENEKIRRGVIVQ